jgi:formylmethanofuran dehydrogenase subunit B
MTTAVVEYVTCLGCGCACDDIGVVVRDGRIVDARNACALGIRWFGDGTVPTRTTIDGRDIPLSGAIAAIGHALAESARPLVLLAPGVSCEAHRAAAALADTLGARLDSITSMTARPFVLATQEHGIATATLGEIRNRADVVVCWGVDLDARYPRFAARYAPEPSGAHVPNGRRGRMVIAVDVGASHVTVDADRRVAIDPADELATLTALEALARSADDAPAVNNFHAGAPWITAAQLAPMIFAGRYVAIIFDAEPDEREQRSPQRFAALASLSQALNGRTRCAAMGLRAGGNRTGADAVLVSQTGFPFAVDFSMGYPRYDPYGRSADSLLEAGDVDIAVVVGDPMSLPPAITAALGAVHTIVIGPRASESSLGSAAIVIDTGIDGIHGAGTAYRTDDVPLPLRACVAGPPPAAEILRALCTALVTSRL